MLPRGAKWGIVVLVKDIVLSGEYEHTVDDKGRLTLPAKFREFFPESAYVARYVEEGASCVTVFPPEAWLDYQAKKIEPLDQSGTGAANRKIRKVYRYLHKIEPDRQGRLLLPADFIKELDLRGRVKVVGRWDRFEIWNPETLAAYDAEEE
jgi:MraZ protein